MYCGGITPVRPFNRQEHKELTKFLYQEFSNGRPVLIRTQLVAGMNYFVRLELDSDYSSQNQTYWHVRIYRDLNGDFHTHSIKKGLASSDQLVYF